MQWALVACLLAQGLMELKLQDKTHKVPAGTGWVLEGIGGGLAQAPSSFPQGSGQTGACLGRRENQAWLRREARGEGGAKPWGWRVGRFTEQREGD